MTKNKEPFLYDTYIATGECSSGLFNDSPVVGSKLTTDGRSIDAPLSWYELLHATARSLNKAAEVTVKPRRIEGDDTTEAPLAFDPDIHAVVYDVIVGGVKQAKFQRAMMLPELIEPNQTVE